MADQFGLFEDISDPTPKRLASSDSVQFSREELTDALLFLYDTFSSLVSLLSFCGSTSNVFLAHGALQRLAIIYVYFFASNSSNSKFGLIVRQGVYQIREFKEIREMVCT